jgi:peptidoglycan hydrolase-like protein with peptidoglycan-binding domain
MSCYVEKVISIAKAEVGYQEKASNSNLDSKTANVGKNNYTKYARDLDNIPGFYNGKKQGYAWCDVFVDDLFVMAYGPENAKRLLCQPNNSAGSGCKESMAYYKSKGQLYTSPKIGDQIFFKNLVGTVCHTGLVVNVDSSYVYTIEGNTSSGNTLDADGGQVCEKKYALNYNRIACYGRPNYDVQNAAATSTSVVQSTVAVKDNAILEWQNAAIKDGFPFHKFGADGEWGSECESVAKQAIIKKRTHYLHRNLTKIVQVAVGVKADGLCGNNTEAAIKIYQQANGLVVDGAVGLNTWKKILGVK